ncbi:MAG: hypothetical protein IPM50_04175 [Acidobacteriota bacterium]|nr:MAG: hypothetical protein IPM50_04175 [Acidobacteriota bacterium]
MAKQNSTQKSRLFEISFEKVETVTVSRRREALVVSKRDDKDPADPLEKTADKSAPDMFLEEMA